MINFWQYKKKANFNKKTFLIVGLGNHGDKYKNTRHNLGMAAIDEIASTLRISLEFDLFNCKFYKGKCESTNFILAKSKGFMNNSGDFIKDLTNHYNIDTDNILVIYDCNDLECGTIKLKSETSGGNHNGMRSVVEKLKTKKIKVVKIGIGGTKREKETLEHYVLNKLTIKEKIKTIPILEIMADIFYDFLKTDTNKLIQKYNSATFTQKGVE